MGQAIQSLAIWFAVEVGLPCLYFGVTEGPKAAVACLTVLLVIYVISAPFVILSIPLWRMAMKMGDSEGRQDSD